MNKERLEPILVILLALLGLVFCFHKLDRAPLERWDEGTNAAVVSSALNSDQPWVLEYQDEPFFEKPPLWYYSATLSAKVLGYSQMSLRLVSACAGFLLVLLVYRIGRDLFSIAAGAIASLSMLATGQLWLFDAGGFFSSHTLRSADSDALQMLLITASFYAFYLVVERSKNWIYAGVGLSALAVMTKGPMGLLPLIVFILFQLVAKNKISFTTKQIIGSAFLFFTIVLPWHIYMIIRFGRGFIDSYLGYHMLQRIGIALEGHSEPWWFYFKVLANKQVFWSVEILFVALILFLAGRYKVKSKYTHFALLVMIVLILLIITSAGTKLAWYVLSAYPFIALLIGGGFDLTWRQPRLNAGRAIALSIFSLILMLLIVTNNFQQIATL